MQLLSVCCCDDAPLTKEPRGWSSLSATFSYRSDDHRCCRRHPHRTWAKRPGRLRVTSLLLLKCAGPLIRTLQIYNIKNGVISPGDRAMLLYRRHRQTNFKRTSQKLEKMYNLHLFTKGERNGDCTCIPPTWPGFDLGLMATSRLRWFLVLYSAPRGFSPASPVFPSPQKSTFPNSNSIGCRIFLAKYI